MTGRGLQQGDCAKQIMVRGDLTEEVMVRMTATMKDDLGQAAKDEERTMAQVVRRALRIYLDRPREERR
jgi:hypothetical protein